MNTRPLEVAIAREVRVGLSDQHIRQLLQFAKRTIGGRVTDVSVAFVSNKTIQKFNKQYRRKDAPTDVLSFCYDQEGEILVSPQKAVSVWKPAGKGRREAIAFVLLHGFLHIAGYDHKTKKEETEMMKINNSLAAEVKKRHYV